MGKNEKINFTFFRQATTYTNAFSRFTNSK